MVDSKKKKPARKATTRKSGTTTARKKTATTRSKAGGKKTAADKSRATGPKSTARARPESAQLLEQQFGSLLEGFSELTTGAMKIVSQTRERAIKSREQVLGKKDRKPSKTPSASRLRQMADAGESLRDLREVAGLTLADITRALNLKDKSVMEAIEDGREALSMEMIMRLASLYARNDPLPFVVKYVRTYRPNLWAILEELGIDGLPVKIERERRFINIYRRRDAARQLSSDGFDKVLAFTQQAFELSLHFIAELEEIENEVNPEFDEGDDRPATKEQE